MLHLFSRNKPSPGPVDAIIVGLGNPGRQYEGTRHNAGFFVLDTLAEQCGVNIDRIKFKGLTCDAVVGDKRVLLLKPSTYMNLSGESVREAMQFYKLPPEQVIIVYDDISLPPGKLRIRRKGSDGGQNGMKNIIYLMGADTFPRIKMGIGAKPNPQWDLADWVLSRFTESEAKELTQAAKNACEALALMVNGQEAQAMNQFNS
jgi:PTH1 family peptidyl-tRNA hydrolase